MQRHAHQRRRASALLIALAAAAGAVAQTAGTAQGAGTATPDLREHLAACAACHGEFGEGIDSGAEFYPHLAGKPAGYLLSQMQAFRDGRRHYPRMVYLMQYMDDRYLGEIAQWYAAQPAQTRRAHAGPSSLDAAAVRRAEQLVFHGDPGRDLPACATCHGDDLAGVEPGIPALVGLPPDYIVAQLGGWVMGARKGEAPDCMAQIARSIDPRDVRLLATWLSEQSAGPDARPGPAGSIDLPMPCGTQPQDGAHAPAANAPALDPRGGDEAADGADTDPGGVSP
jgi:cytochrome c553